jgi:dCMP deaminase
MPDRVSRDAYYMGIARAVAARGTCSRAKMGAIVVVGDAVAATGYNGSPRGTRHCDHADRITVRPALISATGWTEEERVNEGPGDMENGHCSRAVHAEMNVVANATRSGTSLVGGTLYVTATPCYRCAPLLVQVGITRIVMDGEYRPDPRALELLSEAKVALEYLAR